MSILGLVLLAAAPADAQTYQPTTTNFKELNHEDGPFLPKRPNEPPSTGRYAEPEFVPYVNDLQMFDQPDLSAYGRGPRPTEGWFGSAEYLGWTIQSSKNATIGSNTPRQVFTPGATTQNTGVTTLTDITIFTTPNVTFTLPNFTVTVNGQQFIGTLTFTTPYTISIVTPGVTVISSTPGVTQGQFTNNSSVLQLSTLDTGYQNSEFTSGGRFEFGRINNGRGWLVSSFNLSTQTSILDTTDVSVNFDNGPVGFVDISGGIPTATTPGPGNNPLFQGDGFDDDLDGDGVFGRHGRDRGTRAGQVFNPPLDGIPDPENPNAPPVPVDYDDAVPLPVVFEEFHVENRTNMYGVEANRLWRLALGPRGGIWEFFVGPRFLHLRDQFNVEGLGPNTNPQYFLDPVADAYWNTDVQNNAILGQIGGRWAIQRDRWQLSVESRLMAGANFQSFRQMGQFASRYLTVVPTGVTPNPTFTVPLRDDVINGQLPHTFQHAANSVEFIPAGELRINLKYQAFRSVYLQLGYTGLFATNIARAAPMVRYNFPDMGLLEDENKQDLFVNGVDFGIVINR